MCSLLSIPYFIFLLFLAAIATTGLISLLGPPAVHAGLVDNPCERKRHEGSVPLVGGVGIYLVFVTMALFMPGSIFEYVPLFFALGLLLVVGVIDDLVDMTAGWKLIAQITAAVICTSWGNIQIMSAGDWFGTGPILLGDWSIPVTVFCLVGLINAINMLDGIDGLAGGFSFLALSTFATVLFLAGNHDSAMLAVLLAACVAGFLLLNMRSPMLFHARVFLGDAGTMVLGLAIGWFAIEAANSGTSWFSPISVLWVLALPVIDTVSLMVRRIRRGHSPFVADREHLHHLFDRAGFSVQQAASILLGVAITLGMFGIFGRIVGLPDGVMLLGLLLVAAGHVYFISRAWRILRVIRRRRGLSE